MPDAAVAVLARGRLVGVGSLVRVRGLVRARGLVRVPMRVRRAPCSAETAMDATRRRRRSSASSIQPPIATIEIAATTGAARTTRSGASTPCAPSDERRQHEDPDGVRHAHRQPESDRMERPAARADEVRRHQRLAMPRGQGMARTEGGRRQQRHEQDHGRQVGRAEDRWQVPGPDATRHAGHGHGARDRTRRRRCARLGRHACPVDRARVRDIEWRQRRSAQRRDHRHRGLGERPREQVGRVARSTVRRRSPSAGAPPSAAATETPDPTTTISRQPSRSAYDVSANETVVPLVSGVGEVHAEAADLAHRREAARARRERQSSLGQGQGLGSARSPTRRSRDAAEDLAADRPRRHRSPRRRPRRPPSVSRSRRAWKVGISAWSMTTSSRIRSGSMRTPA